MIKVETLSSMCKLSGKSLGFCVLLNVKMCYFWSAATSRLPSVWTSALQKAARHAKRSRGKANDKLRATAEADEPRRLLPAACCCLAYFMLQFQCFVAGCVNRVFIKRPDWKMKRTTWKKKNLISFQLLFVLEDSHIDRFFLTQLQSFSRTCCHYFSRLC